MCEFNQMATSNVSLFLDVLFLIVLSTAISTVYSQVYVESPAVAALFPDPDYPINTPAFSKNPAAFTSQGELEAFVINLTDVSGPNLQTEVLGKSQDGRDIYLLKCSVPSQTKKPIVLIIGQQHGNEPAGGEAALAIASELAQSPTFLAKMNVLIVPRANPDGAARFLRGLSNGDDVNRDHLLLQSPEGEALAKVFREYNPDVVVDCHEYTVAGSWLEKFGGIAKFDGTFQFATVQNLAPALNDTAWAIRGVTLNTWKAHSLTHDWYQTTSRTNLSDSVVSMGGVVPDTGRNIAGLRNSLSFLLETRGTGIGTAHFKRRVYTHLLGIREILYYVLFNSELIMSTRKNADEEVIASAGNGYITIVGSQTPERRVIDLLDPTSGDIRKTNVQWYSALNIQNNLVRKRPFGYLIASSENQTLETLQKLGVTLSRMLGATMIERYTVEAVKEVKKQDVTGSTGTIKDTVLQIKTSLMLEAGYVKDCSYYYVGLDQQLANVIVAALEPESQSSFPANHFMSWNVTQGDTLPYRRVVDLPTNVFPLDDVDCAWYDLGTEQPTFSEQTGVQNAAAPVSSGVTALLASSFFSTVCIL